MWTGPLSEIASGIEVTLFTSIYVHLFNQQHQTHPSSDGQQIVATKRILSNRNANNGGENNNNNNDINENNVCFG